MPVGPVRLPWTRTPGERGKRFRPHGGGHTRTDRSARSRRRVKIFLIVAIPGGALRAAWGLLLERERAGYLPLQTNGHV